MTGPPTVDIHVDNRLTRTSCPLSPCLSALFEKISPPPDKHLRKDIPSAVGVLFTDSTKIHRITGNGGIIVLGVNNFLHNCRKDLIQRNCFFYRTFFYSISTIFVSLRLFQRKPVAPHWATGFLKNFVGLQKINFPVDTFGGWVKNKNETIWVYSEKFACLILNFFKMSISEPVFSLQTHIHLFMRYLQQIQYLTTRFFCIDPKC